MLKILTKYKMVILCVFGILIIIAFLIPDMLRQIGTASASGRTAYTIGGEKVTAGDLAESALKVQRLGMVIQPEVMEQFFGIDKDAEQWQLLSKAMSKAGVVSSPTEGQSRALELAQMRFESMYSRGTTQAGEWRTRAKADLGLTTDAQLDERIADFASNLVARDATHGDAHTAALAFAEQRGLERMMDLYRTSIPASPARQWLATRESMDRIGFNYVFVPIRDGAEAAMPEPSAEQISAHFAKFKDLEAGVEGNVFGYRTPERVSYAFATFSRADFEKIVTVDPVEIQKRLQSEVPAASDPIKRRRELNTLIRNERIDALQRALSEAVRAETARLTSNMPEVNGVRELPAGFADGPGALQTIIDVAVKRVNADKGVSIPMPTFTKVDALQTRGEFIQQPIIGQAALLSDDQRIDAASIVFHARELGKAPEAGPSIRPQVGLPLGQFVTDMTGGISFIVVRQAQKAGSPASADAVKDLVVRDLKKLAATAKLKEEMEKIAVIGGTLSFDDAITQLKSLGYLAESRRASLFGVLGMLPQDPQLSGDDFAKALMARAMKLDATTPLDASSLQDRTFAVQPEGRLGVVLVQITEYQPVAMEDYRRIAANIIREQSAEKLLGVPMGRRMMGQIQSPFKTPLLAKRLGVEGLEKEKK
jgi:hypothetical protein